MNTPLPDDVFSDWAEKLRNPDNRGDAEGFLRWAVDPRPVYTRQVARDLGLALAITFLVHRRPKLQELHDQETIAAILRGTDVGEWAEGDYHDMLMAHAARLLGRQPPIDLDSIGEGGPDLYGGGSDDNDDDDDDVDW
jgi:hypothetical protein